MPGGRLPGGKRSRLGPVFAGRRSAGSAGQARHRPRPGTAFPGGRPAVAYRDDQPPGFHRQHPGRVLRAVAGFQTAARNGQGRPAKDGRVPRSPSRDRRGDENHQAVTAECGLCRQHVSRAECLLVQQQLGRHRPGALVSGSAGGGRQRGGALARQGFPVRRPHPQGGATAAHVEPGAHHR